MILVDSSLWIELLRRGHARLQRALEVETIVIHDFVLGELSLGHLRKGSELIATMESLHRLAVASHDEVLMVIDKYELRGSGIGWIDAHLIASCLIDGVRLWTLDRTLVRAIGGRGLPLDTD